MPQLDSLTYFTQFFWLIICFLALYVLIETMVLPNIAIILKTRNTMKLKKNEISSQKMILGTLSNLNAVLDYSNQINKNGKIWSTKNIEKIKYESLNNLNNTYLSHVSLILIKKRQENIN